MPRRPTLRLQTNLLLVLHRETGTPYALRLNARKAAGLAVTFGFLLTAFFCGTLFFFRELEINRKLLDRALGAEIRGKLLAQTMLPADETREPARAATSASATTSANKAKDADKEKEGESTPAASTASIATARVGDLSADCDSGHCDVELSLLPTSAGVAKGQLLLVLETEIPRIGTAGPVPSVHKRYFVYPGNETADELPQEKLAAIAGKAFHFSRALHTRASFTIGNLLRPLAVNAYLFDADKNLIAHERRAIDSSEE